MSSTYLIIYAFFRICTNSTFWLEFYEYYNISVTSYADVMTRLAVMQS